MVDAFREFIVGKRKVEPAMLARAIPVPNEFVVATEQPDGSLLLEAPLEEVGGPMWSSVAKRSRSNPIKRFELEPVGSFLWRLLDGQTTFQTLSKRLQAEYKLSRIEADASLSAFLQMLSQRRLITMLVEKK